MAVTFTVKAKVLNGLLGNAHTDLRRAVLDKFGKQPVLLKELNRIAELQGTARLYRVVKHDGTEYQATLSIDTMAGLVSIMVTVLGKGFDLSDGTTFGVATYMRSQFFADVEGSGDND